MNRDVPIENDLYYHVYNRGNDRHKIFGDESDYIAFIRKLKSLAVKYAVEVPVYTLMPNHYHLIARQTQIEGRLLQRENVLEGDLLPRLSKMMGALATSAAKRYNLKYEHIGHLFQGPFRYKIIPENALWDIACYIHLNPVRAGFVKEPEKWVNSNFADFLGKRFPSAQTETRQKETFNSDWQGYADYVQEILQNGRAEKELWKRLLTHVEGFLQYQGETMPRNIKGNT